MLRGFAQLSRGEKLVWGAYLVLAICGVPLGYFGLRDIHALELFVGDEIGLPVLGGSAAVGAVLAAFLSRDRFGASGKIGLFRAFTGAIVATLLLGIIAGTLVLPVLGTMFGPWLVLVACVELPGIALLWLGGLYAFHRARMINAYERDSIFRWADTRDVT